eukprot:CAMPEP_0184374272 /NCGR_PEP_ID=MMETSP1089-20130417/164941_1 /TAXON_ID=38269 ORGANISM="Gloeochaete wittrockiana, Strain SAG46.84" /NCGR_SAMPLE_ID=MMETSP1089 /ASSEMBLY_ACC=CAM_ASM_000445 /LENGTH=1084 /DNA_ID=CAMNT_0026717279 /DNA_START=38 /DNA_END=3289 /DNA_ORIENTATION=-
MSDEEEAESPPPKKGGKKAKSNTMSTAKKPKFNPMSMARNGYDATIYWENYPDIDISSKPSPTETISERSVSALFLGVLQRIKAAERERGRSLADIKIKHVKDFGPDDDDSGVTVSADRLHHLKDLQTIVLDALELPRTVLSITVHLAEGTSYTIPQGDSDRVISVKAVRRAASRDSSMGDAPSPAGNASEVNDSERHRRKRRKRMNDDDDGYSPSSPPSPSMGSGRGNSSTSKRPPASFGEATTRRMRKSTKESEQPDIDDESDDACYLCSESGDLVKCQIPACSNRFHRDCLSSGYGRATENSICTDHVGDKSVASILAAGSSAPDSPSTPGAMAFSRRHDRRSSSPPAQSPPTSRARDRDRGPAPRDREKEVEEEDEDAPSSKKVRAGKLFIGYEAHIHWKYSSHSKQKADDVIQSRSTTDCCNKFFERLFEHEMQKGKDIFDCGKMPHIKELQSEEERINGREGVIKNSRTGRIYAVYMDRKSHLYDLYRGTNGGMLKQMGFDPRILDLYGVKASGSLELIIPPENDDGSAPPPPKRSSTASFVALSPTPGGFGRRRSRRDANDDDAYYPPGSRREDLRRSVIKKMSSAGDAFVNSNDTAAARELANAIETEERRQRLRRARLKATPGALTEVADDYCNLCGDGGELICCDFSGCLKVYHLECLSLSANPPEPWYCPDHAKAMAAAASSSASDAESVDTPSHQPQRVFSSSGGGTRVYQSYEAHMHWKHYPYAELKHTDVLTTRNVNQLFTAVLDALRTKELEYRFIDVLLAKPKLSHVKELDLCNIKMTGREGIITAKNNRKFAVLADRIIHLYTLHRGNHGGILRYLGMPPEMVDVYGCRDDGSADLLTSASPEDSSEHIPRVIPASRRREMQSSRGSPDSTFQFYAKIEEFCDVCKTRGGFLIPCCEPKCAKAFHFSCASMLAVPGADWICPNHSHETRPATDVPDPSTPTASATANGTILPSVPETPTDSAIKQETAGSAGSGGRPGVGGALKAAAIQILREQNKPMRANEIVELALKYDMVQTRSSNPAIVMSTVMNQDIFEKKESSIFIRVSPAVFGLRELHSHLVHDSSSPAR